jgi:hypothetical protein
MIMRTPTKPHSLANRGRRGLTQKKKRNRCSCIEKVSLGQRKLTVLLKVVAHTIHCESITRTVESAPQPMQGRTCK